MGYLIEITEKKVEKLSDHIEESLRHLGKAMQCVDEWMSGEMHERGGMNYRDNDGYGRYGNSGGMNERYPYEGRHVNYREHDDWEEMNERRRRDSRGRYM